MKKNLVIVLMAGLMVIGSGCSKHYEGEIIEGTENIIEDEAENDEGVKIDKEILNADIFDNIIQIGNNVIEMPCSYENIENIITPYNPEKFADTRIDNDSVDFCAFTINNMENADDDIHIGFKNSDIQYRKKASETPIAVVGANENKNVIMCGGIRVGSTLKDVKKKYGEPNASDTSKDLSQTVLYYNNGNENIDESNGFDIFKEKIIEIIIDNESEKVVDFTVSF